MARYIDADAIEKEGWHMQRIRQKDYNTMVLETKKPSEFVVERKRGKWIEHTNYVECNKCHSLFTFNGNYCPNCGADMRKGENNEVSD